MKVFSFYGCGLRIVAANTKDEAITIANKEDRQWNNFWNNCEEMTTLSDNGEPRIITTYYEQIL